MTIDRVSGRGSAAPQRRPRIVAHLRALAGDIGPRPAGSPANRRATAYVAAVLEAAGLAVRADPFTTSWWEPGPGTLELADGSELDVAPNPYSPAGRVSGDVTWLATPHDLSDDAALSGRVVVLGPELGGEAVMPTAFPFYQPEAHRRLVAWLQRQRPAAVVAASPRHACVATFEDPELGIPSITVSPQLAQRLRPGDPVTLTVGGRTRDGHGVTVSGRADGAGRRIVVSAHVDSKATTPGAFDNAASVAVLLALAESGVGRLGPVELVGFNGEDHYDACGEQAWLVATDLAEISLNVNLDGVGVAGRRTAVTGLGCSAELERWLDRWVTDEPHAWTRTPPWFESDHAIFAQRGVPAVAITSEGVHDLFTSLAHTAADTVDVVDVDVLVGVVALLRGLLPRAQAVWSAPAGA